jgi:hypothetical protein
MNLFRGEEHVRNWSDYDSAAEDGTMPLTDYMKLFSSRLMRNRLDEDYVSNFKDYFPEFVSTLKEIGKAVPFWGLG